MKIIFTYLSVTLTHAILSVSLFTYSFILGRKRFDTGEADNLMEMFFRVTSKVLYFPVVHLAHFAPKGMLSGLLGYIPILLNSYLWAFLIIFVYKKLNEKL